MFQAIPTGKWVLSQTDNEPQIMKLEMAVKYDIHQNSFFRKPKFIIENIWVDENAVTITSEYLNNKSE